MGDAGNLRGRVNPMYEGLFTHSQLWQMPLWQHVAHNSTIFSDTISSFAVSNSPTDETKHLSPKICFLIVRVFLNLEVDNVNCHVAVSHVLKNYFWLPELNDAYW